MSNTPKTKSLFPTCKRCDGQAHANVGTNQSYGPQANLTTKPSAGKYCLQHAKERALELLPAWEARRQAKREADHVAYVAWRKQYDETRALRGFSS